MLIWRNANGLKRPVLINVLHPTIIIIVTRIPNLMLLDHVA